MSQLGIDRITPMKHYDYILLDWDGNIAQTLDLWPDALHEAMNKRGFSLTRQQLIASTWGFVAYATKHTDITPEEATKALAEANEIVVSRSLDVELFPDAPETLAELKAKGKHLALITTSERRMVMPVLGRYKIADLFEVIVADDDIEKLSASHIQSRSCWRSSKWAARPRRQSWLAIATKTSLLVITLEWIVFCSVQLSISGITASTH